MVFQSVSGVFRVLRWCFILCLVSAEPEFLLNVNTAVSRLL